MPRCTLHPLPYQPDPLHYFSRCYQAPGAILLDSCWPQATRGRFDILSAWPKQQLQPLPEENGTAFFQRLRLALASLEPCAAPANCASPFLAGLLGSLNYDFGRRLEPLKSAPDDDMQQADAQLGLYDWSLVTDHQQQSSQLLFHPRCSDTERKRLIALFAAEPKGPPAASFSLTQAFSPDIAPADYQQAIETVQAYISAGDCYQVNYTQRFSSRYQGDPWLAYQWLRQACPTPFAGFQNLGPDQALLSLSPERFIKLHQRQIETRPIKGTRPRGNDPQEDQLQAQALLASPKDRAENLMIVDLLRNDLGRSSRIGSVKVPELFSLESYPNVHHLVSSVSAELAEGKDALDLLAGSFPGGSITGAPKIRAMQIIDELEPQRRGPYCGSLLYIDVRGDMDSSITIRSLLAHHGRLHCWAGGGIVADSKWQEEYQESLDKVQILLRTLEQPPSQ